MQKLNLQKRRHTRLAALLCATATIAISQAAIAGPFILDLTDADDHGSSTGTVNQNGWLYMQRVLENLAPGVTNGQQTVVNLGSNPSSRPFDAANSSFSLSSLPGMGGGWTWVNVDGAADITAFFDGTGTQNINNTGIIQIDSGSNVGGGIDGTELAAINSNATALDNFLGGGGALHSMAEAGSGQYGWLSTLVPGLTFGTFGGSGLFLTGDGQSAFPGLNNSDLSAGPFHGTWTGGLGGLTTLFEDSSGRPVGIGSAGGSITNPDPPSMGVPEPSSLMFLGIGAIAMGFVLRRRVGHA